MPYIGWKLPDEDKAVLMERFAPTYPDVVAHHVTLDIGKHTKTAPLPTTQSGRVVGIADDGKGIQALVVEIDGATDRPAPLGGTYHITWSMDAAGGYSAKMSNDVIDEGWTPVEPVAITLLPTFFRY